MPEGSPRGKGPWRIIVSARPRYRRRAAFGGSEDGIGGLVDQVQVAVLAGVVGDVADRPAESFGEGLFGRRPIFAGLSHDAGGFLQGPFPQGPEALPVRFLRARWMAPFAFRFVQIIPVREIGRVAERVD